MNTPGGGGGIKEDNNFLNNVSNKKHIQIHLYPYPSLRERLNAKVFNKKKKHNDNTTAMMLFISTHIFQKSI